MNTKGTIDALGRVAGLFTLPGSVRELSDQVAAKVSEAACRDRRNGDAKRLEAIERSVAYLAEDVRATSNQTQEALRMAQEQTLAEFRAVRHLMIAHIERHDRPTT